MQGGQWGLEGGMLWPEPPQPTPSIAPAAGGWEFTRRAAVIGSVDG